ncbi:hypothetical protein Tco_0218168 [Tanacetum coccineum]
MQLIQKLRDDLKCMKKIEPSSRSKATEDIISIGSFVEFLVLNHYVIVRKILGTLSKLQDEDAQNKTNIQEPRMLCYFRLQPVLQNEESMSPKRRLFLTTDNMANEHVPSPATTRSDDQILLFNAWVPIGKALTASADVPSSFTVTTETTSTLPPPPPPPQQSTVHRDICKVTYVVHLLMLGFSEMTTLPIALQDPVIDELAEPIVEVEEQMATSAIDMEEDLAMLFGVEDNSSDDDFKGPEGDEEVWEVNEE